MITSFSLRGESILFCTRTGESFIVSKELKSNLLEGLFNIVPEQTIEMLLGAKGLVDIEEDELLEIRNENKLEVNSSTELYTVIQPSANCQLGCYYCGQNHTKTNLTRDYYEPLLERINEKASSGKFKSLYIGWFGGEPLMALPQMRELTPKMMEIAHSHNMSYGSAVVTNGLSLKPNIFEELVTLLGVRKIEVTLDGTSEYHDKHRYTKEGGKSFDLIFKNLSKILNRKDFRELNCPISIRCNVDKKNWNGVSPLINLLAENDLHTKISYFYPIGVYSWGGNDAHKSSLTKEEFAEKEIDWYIEMLKAGFTTSVLPKRHKQVCMAVSPDSEMYDAYGNVFNCTEVSYTDNYKDTPYVLGNLKSQNEIRTQRPLSDWNDTILTDKFPCHTCKLFPVCGGACPKSWHEDLRACPSFKFNIKERLALGYVLSRADIKQLL